MELNLHCRECQRFEWVDKPGNLAHCGQYDIEIAGDKFMHNCPGAERVIKEEGPASASAPFTNEAQRKAYISDLETTRKSITDLEVEAGNIKQSITEQGKTITAIEARLDTALKNIQDAITQLQKAGTETYDALAGTALGLKKLEDRVNLANLTEETKDSSKPEPPKPAPTKSAAKKTVANKKKST